MKKTTVKRQGKIQVATICYCVRDGKNDREVLLGMKKIRFGAGRWNGFGGKVDPGETIAEAAGRELLEEAGLTTDPTQLEKVALVSFYFGETPMFECHIFVAREWSGEPQESDEMRPEWFPIDKLPLDDMWISDPYWLPQALAGQDVEALCRFDDAGTVVREFKHVPFSNSRE